MMPAAMSFGAEVELASIPDRKVFWKEIEKQMRVEGREFKKLYHDWIDTWESKPRFKVKITRQTRRGQMTGSVTPTADEGLLQIMNWVIHGTGIHSGAGYYPIPKEPKSGGDLLWYRDTYTPATQPGVIQSRQSSYSGPWKSATQVWHPGIRPRNITLFILQRRYAKYINSMGEATKRALIASTKAGKA